MPLKILDAPSKNFDERPEAKGGDPNVRRVIVHGTAGKYPHDLNWLIRSPAPNRVSAHFYIAKTGDVYRLVPMHLRAWHARGHNADTVGIELECRGPGDPYTDAQYRALACLLAEVIFPAHPHLKMAHVMGHVDVDPKRKSDPWEQFDWDRLRLEVMLLVEAINFPEPDVVGDEITPPEPILRQMVARTPSVRLYAPVKPVAPPSRFNLLTTLRNPMKTAARALLLGLLSLLATIGWVSPELQEFVHQHADQIIAVLSGAWGLVAAARALGERSKPASPAS